MLNPVLRYWYVLRSLGAVWLVLRIVYRFKLKFGWFEHQFPRVLWEERSLASYLADPEMAELERYHKLRQESNHPFLFAPFSRDISQDHLFSFDADADQRSTENCIVESDKILKGSFRYFTCHGIQAGFAPVWFSNPFQKNADYGSELQGQHWSQINDFIRGDIKAVWELSRFGFVYPLVRAYWRTGDEKYADGFWDLVEDWRSHNSPQIGPHWKCGQEISFRVMAWTFGLYGFLDAGTTTPGRVAELARMIAVSAEHIEGNISYALSQKNNHPISEAMGLWTVGILFPEFKSAERWKTRGREILEECGRELIYPDGTFSQYSTNYHRLMLHDYLWVLSLAGKNGEIFSEELIDRVRAAGRFLVGIIDPATGRVPNLGTNDGALILPLTDCDYLDYRPVVQAVRVLLTGERAFPPGPWDEVLFWLGLTAPEYSAGDIEAPGSSDYFENGGYLVLRGNRSRAVIRCTSEYRHRPSHADQLHLDLWYDSTNMLRDSGTYSYNAPPDDSYFSSTGAHNTVEFDGRDQMPRLSRFLFGEWIGVKTTEPLKESAGRISWAGAYRDWRGCSHERRVELDRAGDTWTITDRVSGYMEKAVLRWRLAPELNWRLEGGCVIGDGVEIMINSDDALAGISIVDGWESLYYFEKKTIPVLEVEMPPPSAEVKTVIKFIS